MDERTAQVHDHIAALIDEPQGERLAHGEQRVAPPGSPRRLGLRRRAGRALMALGEFVAGPPECDSCPDGAVAAGGA
jgi:hypothetical protein